MLKFICKLAYKAGELSTKSPKISTKPIKEIIRQFKLGRRANEPIDYADYPDLNN